MSEILNSAIVKVQNAKYAFCRFITANDTGTVSYTHLTLPTIA